MRILVTRPLEDARAIADKLTTMGHEAVIAPLLAIRFHDGEEISLDGVQAILATSANGVRAIARRTERRDVPVFAVGPQTAEEAQRLGFRQVRNAQGDGEVLAKKTLAWAKPDGGVLLHAAGAEAPKSLAAELERHGFRVRREVLYEAVAADALPPDIAATMNTIDAVLLFSPRSAAIFRELLIRAGLGGAAAHMRALCISAAAAKALAPLTFREIRTAEKPDQAALLSLLR